MTLSIVYIIVAVLVGAVGQILLKKGMARMGPLTLSMNELWSILWRIATNPYVVVGLTIYMCGSVFWLVALSRVELSYAYPFASLSYVIMLVASWLIFNENINSLRVLGSIVVGLGVFLTSRS